MSARTEITPPLSLVGTPCNVPRSAFEHSHVREAAARVRLIHDTEAPVVGTANNGRAELYGWHNPVSAHVDSQAGARWMYGMLLDVGNRLAIYAEPAGEPITRITPVRGQVFRLDDSVPHWTEGTGISTALFVGCFSAPDDWTATRILARGLARLCSGSHRPPRVHEQEMPGPGECWAEGRDGLMHIMRTPTAERLGLPVADCAHCSAPAAVLDHHYPYFANNNRCLLCVGKDPG